MKLEDVQYPGVYYLPLIMIINGDGKGYWFNGVNLNNEPICKWIIKLK